ncbi:MAG: 23S rRNA (uracil(1939)-C(5))-methyltransferase RlmD [Thermodesulfobacterium sp.]|nr:23S rRNA (uracil(1939)-C(5))-methyltransferase RlmD [Thermodesulfobacterium sp.]
MQAVLKVEKIIFGGNGLARLPDGKVVFIPYVIPEEVLQVKIIKDYGDHAEAEVEKFLEASPYRREAPCPYYGICGGCQLQHISYSYQIKIKEDILFDTFKRLGWKEEISLEKVVSSSKEFNYRNRLRFHVENDKFKMGFVKRKTHEVLKIEKCLLGEDILNKVIAQLYKNLSWIKLSYYSKRIKIETSPEEDKVTLIFWTSVEPLKEDIKELLSIEELKAVFYWMKGRRPEGPFPEGSPYGGRRVFKNIDSLFYYVQPGVFVQANWEINCAIMEIIKSWDLSFEKVLDLHAGMGNFLFPLLHKKEVKKFLGIDTDLRAIEDGLYTAERAGINGRFDLRNISAMEALYEAVKEGEEFDLVLLDPPRGGCKELMKLLPEVAKKYIIYISCDVPTLVRDLLILKKLNYELIRLSLFDMFPQTYHFETVALLEKKG